MTDPRIGTRLAGYQILELIGRGGMGVVYLAEHAILQRRAALKVIAPELAGDPQFRQRFIDESRLAASIDHPNIVPIYEAGEADGALFIAMRYVEGGDLRTLIKRDGPLPPERVIAILGPIAGALDAAHAVGLVHRDVKSANILVDARDGRPYLTDFGITKSTSATSGLTRTGQLVGSPEYMAPEQVLGSPIDGRADQYALACVAFEALSGHVPHERDTELATLYARVNDEPPDVRGIRPELPAAVADTLVRALARKPSDRYPTCAAMLRALGEAVASSEAPTVVLAREGATLAAAGVAVPVPGGSSGPPSRRRSRPLVPLAPAGAIGLAVLALAGVLAFNLVGGPTPSPSPSTVAIASLATPSASIPPAPTSSTGTETPLASPSATPAPPTVTPGPTPVPTVKPTKHPTPPPATPTPTPAPPVPAALTSPGSGTILGQTATFIWNDRPNFYTYTIYVGSTPPSSTCLNGGGCTGSDVESTSASHDYSDAGCGGGEGCYGNPYRIDATVTGWPAGSGTVYVRLITRFKATGGGPGASWWRDYSYGTSW